MLRLTDHNNNNNNNNNNVILFTSLQMLRIKKDDFKLNSKTAKRLLTSKLFTLKQ